MSSFDLGENARPVSISQHVIGAMLILQGRQANTDNVTRSEVLDLALDELARHPTRVGDPLTLANFAEFHARTTLSRRGYNKRRKTPQGTTFISFDQLLTESGSGSVTADLLRLELEDFVNTIKVESRTRTVLRLLLAGYLAEDIAELAKVPLSQAQVWVSRARKSALRHRSDYF